MSTEVDVVRYRDPVHARASGSTGTPQSNPQVQRYEYVVMDLGDDSGEVLNIWGSRGWDLVSVAIVKNKPRAYLKRPAN